MFIFVEQIHKITESSENVAYDVSINVQKMALEDQFSDLKTGARF